MTAISPVDGRYGAKTRELSPIFSEFGLIRNRLIVEIRWLQAMAQQAGIPEVTPFGQETTDLLNGLIRDFNPDEALQVKKIESRTNHDVKAIEYYLRERTAG